MDSTTRFFIACILSISVLSALHAEDEQATQTPAYPTVTIVTTSMGEITAELYPDSAPQSVKIFLS